MLLIYFACTLLYSWCVSLTCEYQNQSVFRKRLICLTLHLNCFFLLQTKMEKISKEEPKFHVLLLYFNSSKQVSTCSCFPITFQKVSAVLQSCDTGPVLTSWVKPMYLRSFTAQHRKQRNFPRLNSQAKIHLLTETSFLTHHSQAWQSLLPPTVFPTYHEPLLELILLQHSHLVGSKPLGCYSCPSTILTSPELCLTSAWAFV